MSIRLRLSLLFSVAVLLLLAGGGVLFVDRLRGELDKSLTMTLGARADNLAGLLANVRAPLTQSYLRAHHLQRSLNGTYAQLLTPTGRVIDNSQRVENRPLLTRREARLAVHHQLVLDESVRVNVGGDSSVEPMRLLARRLHPSGDLLVVAVSRDVADAAVSGARDQFLLLGACVLLLAGPGAWVLTRAALRPVERMRIEVGELSERNAGTGLRVPRTGDEIAALARTFNSLLARLQAALAREQALVADAGHELRTPLTVLKGELELARRPNRTRDELATTVSVAAEETDRLVRLTEDLLFLSREEVDEKDDFPMEEFDVVGLAAQAVAAVAQRALERRITVEVRAASSPVFARGNREWIGRAIGNLLANAVGLGPPGTAIVVAVTGDEQAVRVTVSDDGPGFPPEFLPVAFDRFTRADDARRRPARDVGEPAGTGLGLAIVASILARHGGSAVARNRSGGGAEVEISWPGAVGSRLAAPLPHAEGDEAELTL